jgi:hypothetical protein
MNLSTFSKQQLYQIATDIDKPLADRYEAARELQSRRFNPNMLPTLVRMWPSYVPVEIAEHLGLPVSVVVGMAHKYGLIRRIEE